MPKVKTTLWPDRVIEVDETEETDLRVQGLILDDDAKKKGD